MSLLKVTDKAILGISRPEACMAVVSAAKIALVSQYERCPAFRGMFVVGCRKIEFHLGEEKLLPGSVVNTILGMRHSTVPGRERKSEVV